MVTEPALAIAELARCLRPGGELVGSTFLAEGSWRQRKLLGRGEDTGVNGTLCTGAELRGWLSAAGVEQVEVGPERGFAIFRGRRVGSRT